MKIMTTLGFFGILIALAVVPSIADRTPETTTPEQPAIGEMEVEACPFQQGEMTAECPYKRGEDAGQATPDSGEKDADAKCPYSGGETRQVVGTYRT